MKITSLDHQFIPAMDKDSQKLMIVLHGLGDSNRGYNWLPETLNLPKLNYLLLNAPDKYFEGYSWYEIPNGRIANKPSEVEKQTVARSRNLLWKLLDEVQEQGISINDVLLFGFSQGCVMSLEVALRYPKVFAGVIGVSGYLFDSESVESELSEKAKLQKILITHGDADPIIPMSRAQDGVTFLKNLGVNVRFNGYPKAHTIDPFDELPMIQDWIVSNDFFD